MRPVVERFLGKISVVESGCWIWIAAKDIHGYGRIGRTGKLLTCHRFIYEYYNGEINSDLVVHHKCHNRACCNPSHLEARTRKENVLDINSTALAAINSRKTHCVHGHGFTPENTGNDNRGDRYCIKCTRIRARDCTKRKKLGN